MKKSRIIRRGMQAVLAASFLFVCTSAGAAENGAAPAASAAPAAYEGTNPEQAESFGMPAAMKENPEIIGTVPAREEDPETSGTVRVLEEDREITGGDEPAEEVPAENLSSAMAEEPAREASELIFFTETALEKDAFDGAFVNPLQVSAEANFPYETDGDWDLSSGEWLEGYTSLFGAPVQYASSDPSVASVDGCGIVTMYAPGETVITAAVEASDGYPAAQASYTLTVTGEPRTDLAGCEISLLKNVYTFGEYGEVTHPESGAVLFDAWDWPAVLAMDGSVVLTEGGDYYPEPGENTEHAGQASMTLYGIGAYYGSVRLEWTIEKARPSLSFASDVLSKRSKDKAFTNPLTQKADGKLSFTSSDPSVASVNRKGRVTLKGKGVTVITASVSEGTDYLAGEASYTLYVDMVQPSVRYSAKVVGENAWQAETGDGAEAGTTGRSLIMEAFRIHLLDGRTGEDIDPSLLDVEYSGHIQNIGWDSWSGAGEAAGRPDRGLRMEALKIRLTGTLASQYHIYYALHCQNYGWLDWAKDGEPAGTAGMALRVEALRVLILPKTDKPPERPGVYSQAYMYSPTIFYTSYVEGQGWQKEVRKNGLSGTSGQALRLEGIRVRISGEADLGIEYRGHVQNIGWEKEWARDGGASGRPGSGKRIEAFELRLTGDDAGKYDLYYCLHVQNFGWLAWASNGDRAGSSGVSMRVEAYCIRILPKGSPRPKNLGSRTDAFVDGIGASLLTLNQSAGSVARGKTLQLKAEVLPANRTFKGVTWTSSNPAVASVKNGVVTGHRRGTAKITAMSSDGRASAVCTVTVR